MKRTMLCLWLVCLSSPALPATLPYANPADLSVIRPPFPFEVGVNMHLDGLPDVANIRDMGGTWVRIDIDWESVEASPGVWDFSSPDTSVHDARSQGLKIYATLAYAPAWARKSLSNTGVPDPQAWMNFVRQVARHYCGQIEVYGIWNEPNLEDFWEGSAEDYVEVLLKPAYGIIQQESPGARVAGPELAHLYSARLGVQEFFDTVKRLHGDDYFDILSHHIYGGEEFAQRISGYTFAGFTYRPGLAQMLRRAGLEGKEVWITETGADVKGSDETAQAQLITRQLTLLKAQPWIKKAFIYQLGDDAGEGLKWGLMRPDRSLKPAYFSVQNLIHYENQENPASF
jgi:hypothetical protein